MLYPQLLEGSFHKLPRALRDFHTAPGGGRASGTVAVHHTSRLLAWVAGLPPRGKNIPMHLEVIAGDDREVWIRRFGPVVRKSVQRREGDLLLEMAGPVRVLFRIAADETGMRFESMGARLWGIPLPLRIEARAFGDDRSWNFEVAIGHIGSYGGAMVPAP